MYDIEFQSDEGAHIVASHHEGVCNTYRDRDFILSVESSATFYGCMFQRCSIKIVDCGRPAFLNCVLKDCVFDPPLPAAGGGLGKWEGVLRGCMVESPMRDAREHA